MAADEHSTEALRESLLGCGDDEVPAWLDAHQDELSLALLDALKRSSDERLLSEPGRADLTTRRALEVASRLPHEPLALPLASWARGNWAQYHAPGAVVVLYERAIDGYRAAGDRLSVARLLGNLLGALAERGRFAEAQLAFDEAHAILVPLGENAALYLLRLQQNYGWLLHVQGRYAEAQELASSALDLAHQLDLPVVAAELQVNRTLALGMLGRLAEGEAALLHEREVASRHSQSVTVARIDLNLGELYAAQGRLADALDRISDAHRTFLAIENGMEVGTALLLMAGLFERIGALVEARRHYELARASFVALEMLPYVAETLLREASIRRRQRRREAAQLLGEAEQLWRQLDMPDGQVAVELERARGALARARPHDALAVLDRSDEAGLPLPIAMERAALRAEAHGQLWQRQRDRASHARARSLFDAVRSFAAAQGLLWLERQALVGLGSLAVDEDAAAARELLDRALAIDEQMRRALSVAELKASFHAQTNDVMRLLVALGRRDGAAARALRDVWQVKGGALLDLLAVRQEGGTGGIPDVAYEQLRQRLAAERWRLARERDDSMPDSRREQEDATVRALSAQLAELRRSRNRPHARLAAPRTDPGGVVRVLGVDGLVEYVRDGARIVALWADAAGQCGLVEIGRADDLMELLDLLQLSFRSVLAQPADRRVAWHERWLAESAPLLRRGYELLLAPISELGSWTRVLLAPCEPLHLMPFAALWDGEQYAVERHELVTSPCAILASVELPAAGVQGPPVVIGDTSGGQLPGVREEVEAVARALPGAIASVDDPAAIGYLRELNEAPAILHIAAHTTPRDDAPLLSALQVAGGSLSVEQCYDLPLLGTHTVILSGCATAAGLETGGSLLAFQSAFLVAGTRSVVASLWPVEDRVTARWMEHLAAHLASEVPAPAAVCQTQRELLAMPEMAHPAIWAAFSCSRR